MGGQRYREWRGDARRRVPHSGRGAVGACLRRLTNFQPRLGVLGLATCALLGATGCGGTPTELDDGGSLMLAGGGAVLERDPAIAGLWNRQALATDGTGNVFSIQTIWTFQDDGTVQRRLTTYDMFSEIASEMASTGTWTTARGTMSGSGTVTIQFSAPTAAVLHLPYQFGRDARGEVLLLDGLIYQRSFR